MEANATFECAIAARVNAGDIVALPDVERTIRSLRDGGCQVCLTTGFSGETREQIVGSLGWAGLVDLTLSPDDKVRGRPHPDLVLEVMRQLGVEDAAHVAVVGDTSNDMLCGRAAGAAVVAGVLTGAHDRATLEGAGATHILASFAELPAVLAV